MDYGLTATFVIAVLVLLSILSSAFSFRLGAPLLLVFLAVGLLAGEDGPGQIHFNDAHVAYLIGSVALAVILFDSGFASGLSAFRAHAGPALSLATVGVAITALLVGAAARWLLPFTWAQSLLLGAIVASTDAAAVFFLLRTRGVRIRERTRSVLEIESGSNDPAAIFLTVVLLEAVVRNASPQDLGIALLVDLIRQFGLGILLGIAGGWCVERLNNAFDMDSALYPLIVLSAALAVFAGTSLLGGSGFLAIYVTGLFAGNRPLKAKGTLRRFQSAMTWLAQILMFLTLGLFATPSQFGSALLPALVLAGVLTFLARPIATAVCLAPFRIPARDTTFVAWVGLRGAVSILLALLPIMEEIDHAGLMFNTVFLMVVFSLMIQGWTIRPVARLLRQVEDETGGLLDRIELELPGRSTQHDLVAYKLGPDSPALGDPRLPRWARPSLIVRGEQSIRPHKAGELREGDLVYLFCSERHIKLLDRIYAGGPPGDEREFLGDFSLPPDTAVDLLAERYGIQVPADLRGKSLKDGMSQRLLGRPELGDRVALGPFELIVRDINGDGEIMEVGLLLDNPDAARR
jgi:cell volume regulation protein A